MSGLVRQFEARDRKASAASIVLAVFLLLASMAASAEPEIPANVQTWLEACAKAKERDDKRRQGMVASAQDDVKRAKTPAERKQAQTRFKTERDEFEKAEKQDAIYGRFYVEMPVKPEVGQIGYVQTARVIDVIDDTSAIVELTRVNQNVLVAGPATLSRGTVIVTGVDTKKWANDSGVKLSTDFEAVEVDKAHRMIVLKPFDADAWEGKFKAPKAAKKK